MQKFNIGEWSEAYVFLDLLAVGQMNAQPLPGHETDAVLKIISVMKTDSNGNRYEFRRNNDSVRCFKNEEQYKSIAISDFSRIEKICFYKLKEGNKEIPEVQDFYTNVLQLDISILKSKADNKDDIILKVENSVDNSIYTEGFSIKSKIGSNATLFNCGSGSNLVYTLEGIDESIKQKINSIVGNKDSIDLPARLNFIRDNNIPMNFENSKCVKSSKEGYGGIKIDGNYFAWNLDLLDWRILLVLSEMVKRFHQGEVNGKRINSISEMINIMKIENPLQVRFPENFYEAKMRQFLFASFCGLTATKKWDGRQKVNGGYIEVQKDGNIFYQKALSDESFTDYLIANTKFDGPSKSKEHGNYGYVYFDEEYNSYCIDLNFQIRFK